MKSFLISFLFFAPLAFSVNYQTLTPLLQADMRVQLEVLSWSPRVFIFRKFLTEEECDYLIEQSRPFLTRSTVVNNKAGGRVIDYRRTSSGMTFPLKHNDPILQSIEERIACVSLIPIENGEPLQVLQYDQGGEYRPHYDYFDPKTPGGAAHYNLGGQRVVSFLMYLNTPEAGGETLFPAIKAKVVPIKGDALLFFDCKLNGTEDSATLHGGAPVLKGEKWLATKWLRQFRFEPKTDQD